MFVQIIQGQAADPAKLRTQFDRWVTELGPSAEGWLGATAGVTESGDFLAVVRFESEEHARRQSERPEQDSWWQETAAHLDGEATFLESREVDLDLPGDPAQASFVQVIQGQSSDPQHARELMKENPDEFAAFRPDVLGSFGAQHEGGRYTAVIYFTSEQEARKGEQKEMPEAIHKQMATMGELEVGEPRFLDLKDPWLYSPR